MEALTKTIFRTLVVITISVVLASCSSQPAQSSNPTARYTPASTITPLPSKVALDTPTPSATAVPTEIANGTITLQNAAEIIQFERLGQGMVDGTPFYSMDGELLVIPTTLGVDLYEARTLRKLTAITPFP
ncbi:MAG: hypothetical protein FIA98_07675 [Anaerolineae bacterium]|nr:hypothetical protein [Anaerolineae bacterium]